MKVFAFVCFLLLVFQSACLGDVVNLKNGSRVEGIILEAEQSGIVLEVNCGVVFLPAQDIESAKQWSQAENEGLRKCWDEENEQLGKTAKRAR